ncbi:unnamed protein product [Umbelopsis vinacea]
MDKWVVRKTRTLNNPKECPKLELGQTPVFKFQDSLYNSHLTGHQRRSGGVAPSTSWMHMREQKIKSQLPERSSDIFKGVNIYINGYTGDNKDLQLKQLISKHGGSVSYALAQRKVTHIIVQTNLSGSKLQQYLTVCRNLTKVVSSEWIMDSIANGKRLSEWKYRVLKDEVLAILTQTDLLPYVCNQSSLKLKETQNTASRHETD